MDLMLARAQLFLPVLVRVSAIVLTMPVFGNRNLPPQLRLMFSLVVALVLLPIVDIGDVATVPADTLLPYVFLVVKEAAVGLIIGMAANLLFFGIQFAGEVMGIHMGFGIVRLLAPMGGDEMPVLSLFHYILSLLIFLSMDGHHFLLRALAASFDVIPLAGAVFTGKLAQQLVTMTGEVFVIGIKIAAPVLLTLFLTDVALGVIARSVPQMNVFIVGFPVKIGMGMVVMALTLPFFSYVFQKLVVESKGDIMLILKFL